METTTRNATLGDLAAMLQAQQARKIDTVLPATNLAAENGLIRISGVEPMMDEDGVTPVDGLYRPTVGCVGDFAGKLGVPVQYLRKTYESRTDIFDANINGWLHGFRSPEGVEPCENDPRYRAPDERSFLFRSFRGDDGGEGIGRALLSDRFLVVDHLDALMAALEGVKEAGVEVNIQSCDLTERRMYVRIVAPEIKVAAAELLKGYRSPYTRDGNLPEQDMDKVVAGFDIRNSETGDGRFLLVPVFTVLICTNGLVRTVDAIGRTHLGGKLEEGIVRWSDETQQKSLELITMQTRDAVASFLDVEYLRHAIEEIEAKAGSPVSKPDATIRAIGKQLSFTETQIETTLEHFISGGQLTAGGVLNAVTSMAQTVADADTAHDIEEQAFKAFDLAVAAS